jgi:hypothetical protein
LKARGLGTFEQIKPGARIKGLDPAGIAEIVQVARFGTDALNILFRWMGGLASASSIAARRPVSSL